ncbi:MAG: hypothetical protein GF341_02070 [candidate division Zixibacteria bacterium]|nr:hypothetical protein [candidate division Zixibacteria bacterium]
MKRLLICAVTLSLVCGFALNASAGVDPGARDSVWLEDVVWDGDTNFTTDLYTETDDSLKQATIVLMWSSNQIEIDSVSLIGSRWETQVTGGNGFFVGTYGEVGGVPSDVHYNISFLPFGQLLPTGSGLAGRIHWSRTTTVTEELFTVDTSTTSSGSVVNTTLFGTSSLEGDNFVPAFDTGEIDAILCDCPSQGDISDDDVLDAVDLNMLIDIIFFNAPDVQDPQCPDARSNLNCDAVSDAVDLNILIEVLFFNGSACDPCQP